MAQVVINAMDQVAKRYGKRLAELGGDKGKTVMLRALNAEGDKGKTRVTRELTKQTGLKRKVIVKAIKRKGASRGDLSYALKTRGGNIRLQFFGAREKGSGVTAKPRGQTTQYRGAFMKQGWVNRSPFTKAGMAGNVFVRVGAERLPIRLQKSGVYIPEEMVRGATEAAWRLTPPAIADQVGRQLARVLRGF